MYKAKILKVEQDRTFKVSIPSLGLENITSYAVVSSRGVMDYREGDLVIVDETNDPTWVILGLVYGANS